jgi:hypothetical protein
MFIKVGDFGLAALTENPAAKFIAPEEVST